MKKGREMREKIYNDVLNRIVSIVNPEITEQVGMNVSLEEMGIDSLSLISFIVQIEGFHDIQFKDEYLEEIILSDIDALVDIIISLIEHKG